MYLAVVLDAFSRKVIGWALGRTLEATLTIQAWQMALRTRKPVPGLVHHSDRGVQYASGDYTDLLKANGIQISMSRRGNPYDNAQCELFMKTLKYEEVYRNEYPDLAEARAHIGAFLELLESSGPLDKSLTIWIGHWVIPCHQAIVKLSLNPHERRIPSLIDQFTWIGFQVVKLGDIVMVVVVFISLRPHHVAVVY